jgi:hypothetical protein
VWKVYKENSYNETQDGEISVLFERTERDTYGLIHDDDDDDDDDVCNKENQIPG